MKLAKTLNTNTPYVPLPQDGMTYREKIYRARHATNGTILHDWVPFMQHGRR